MSEQEGAGAALAPGEGGGVLRTPRGRLIVTVATAGLVCAVAIGLALARSSPPEESEAGSRRTVPVERSALTDGLSLRGETSFGDAAVLVGQGGTVTALPRAGDVVGSGEQLLAVDGRPMLVLPGETPLWRVLRLGDEGADVATLRQALIALGYAAGEPGGTTFDRSLDEAVGALYRDRGHPEPAASGRTSDEARQARLEVENATSAVAAARAALRERAAGPTAADRAEARAAVVAAEAALQAAQARATRPVPEGAAAPADVVQGDDAAEPQAPHHEPVDDELPALRAAVDAARARAAELDKAPDTGAEHAAVTAATAALEAAQRALAASTSNAVGPGDVLLVPDGSVRVHAVQASAGDPADKALLEWTGTTLLARATTTPDQAAGVAPGAAATVQLPDGRSVAATVTEVRPATTQQERAVPPTVEVAFDDAAAVAGTGAVGVGIELAGDAGSEGLVVPVTALLALAEGGYAVEVDTEEGARLVGVEVLRIADTRVQVRAPGLDVGDQVVVP